MKIQLPLTEECTECWGVGRIRTQKMDYVECSYCYGTGKIPTEEGKDLLDFIKTFRGWEE